MMATTNRAGFLERILGKDKANAVRADLRKAREELDKAGVQRKQAEGEAVVDAPPEEAGDAIQAAAAKLAQQITDAVSGDLAQLTPELLTQAIAAALQPMASEEMAADGEEDQPPADQEEEDQQAADKALLRTQQDAITGMTRDMGEMAKAYVEAVTQFKSITPLVSDLVEWKADIEKRLSDRPRQASGADETVIDDAEEVAKSIASAAKKAVKGNHKVLGIPVTEE